MQFEGGDPISWIMKTSEEMKVKLVTPNTGRHKMVVCVGGAEVVELRGGGFVVVRRWFLWW